jgi:hypothetical protein
MHDGNGDFTRRQTPKDMTRNLKARHRQCRQKNLLRRRPNPTLCPKQSRMSRSAELLHEREQKTPPRDEPELHKCDGDGVIELQEDLFEAVV